MIEIDTRYVVKSDLSGGMERYERLPTFKFLSFMGAFSNRVADPATY